MAFPVDVRESTSLHKHRCGGELVRKGWAMNGETQVSRLTIWATTRLSQSLPELVGRVAVRIKY